MMGPESLQRGAHEAERARGPTTAWVGRGRETAILGDPGREGAGGRGRLGGLSGGPWVGKTGLGEESGAEGGSLVVLRFLARELREIRALGVATYRESEVRESAAHAALLSEIGREGTTIPLRGLSIDEVAEFIRGAGGLPADRET